MSHPEHSHCHTHDAQIGDYEVSHESAFPAASEMSLVALARQVKQGRLVIGPRSCSQNVDTTNIRIRIGPSYPKLDTAEQAAVDTAFTALQAHLPQSHPRYDAPHASGDEGCDKIHGPLSRAGEAVRAAILSRIRHKVAKGIAASVFRVAALCVCPGDDILASFLKLSEAFTERLDERPSEEAKAILPGRPRARFEGSHNELPLDYHLDPTNLPHTPEGDELRTYILREPTNH